jgi:hypothetical protein
MIFRALNDNSSNKRSRMVVNFMRERLSKSNYGHAFLSLVRSRQPALTTVLMWWADL